MASFAQLARLFKPSADLRDAVCTHPTTLFLSVHKGASSFLSADFAPAIVRAFPGMKHVELGQELVNGKKVTDFPLPPTGLVVSRVYTHLYHTVIEEPKPAGRRFSDKKLIMLRRDPRDVAVSLYYSVRYSHTSRTRSPEDFAAKRAALNELDVKEGVAQVTSTTAIKQFLATFRCLKRYPNICLTTYETLTTNFAQWRRQIEEYMGWTEKESQRVFAGLDQALKPPEEVDPYKHKRRVTPGNWREVFDDRLRDLFEAQIGRELAEAGYTW